MGNDITLRGVADVSAVRHRRRPSREARKRAWGWGPARMEEDERGTALIEAAIIIPILLLIGVGLFEFGRAYQHAQILTNAAREGARMAVLPNATIDAVKQRVRAYMRDGSIPNPDSDAILVDVNKNATMTVNGSTVSASEVRIDYPFNFIVLAPVAKLVNPASTASASRKLRVAALMRNEAQ